jgi:hypothetical protein
LICGKEKLKERKSGEAEKQVQIELMRSRVARSRCGFQP